MKKKSDYAFVVCCNPGYGFGLISSMNAQNHFGTDADWEIAYEDYTEEQRNKISESFPFNVNWTPVSELMTTVVDKRSDKRPDSALNRFWLGYWLLALKVMEEKKYKAICVIQADQFVFINLDVYFKIAETGIIASSEYSFSRISVGQLPFGKDTEVWDRSQCAAFDSVNFIGAQYTEMVRDIILMQCEDPFKGESNFSVVALNRAICRHGSKEKVLSLERNTWVCDGNWPFTRFNIDGYKIYNSSVVQINSWHTRWWEKGRVTGDWAHDKNVIMSSKDNLEYMCWLSNREFNYHTIREFMEKFNSMIPAIASQEYEKGDLKRPKFEWGAK
jgi:hypothetical protein